MFNLYESTLTLLKERDPSIKLEDIASGAGLNFYWLKSLLKNSKVDPGVKKIQRLHDYLLSKKTS